MVIFDFVHGQVVNTTADPEAAQRLREALHRQAREIAVGAGGVPGGSAAS